MANLGQQKSRNFAEFKFAWQPKQSELYELYENSQATTIGGGGARGGGKSIIGTEINLFRRLKYSNTPGLIFRRKYKDLLSNIINPLFSKYPQLKPYYTKSERTIYLPNGSSLLFGYAEYDNDILDFHGQQYADITIDESQRCSSYVIMKLKENNRCTTNLEITPKMLLLFNPGDVGHSLNKRLFIEKDYIENEDPAEYAFLQIYGWDNVEWCRKSLLKEGYTVEDFYSWSAEKRQAYFINKSQYGRKLNTLPDAERRAQLFGDWDVFEGQFFSMWRRDLHIKKHFDIPDEWEKLGGLDYGQRTVCEVLAVDPEGTIIRFAELFNEHKVPYDRAVALAEFLLEHKLYKLDIVYDTNMDINLKEYTGYDKTPISTFREVCDEKMGKDKAPNFTVVEKRADQDKNYRAVCNEAFKEYLGWEKDKEGNLIRRPKFISLEEGKMFNSTLPELIYPEDEHMKTGLDFDQTVGIDDPYDAVKYPFLRLQKPIPKKEIELIHTLDEYMEKIVFAKIKKKIKHPVKSYNSM